MKLIIQHEIAGRIRFATPYGPLTDEKADLLHAYLLSLPGVIQAKVYERSGNAVVTYQGSRQALLANLVRFSFTDEKIAAMTPGYTARQLNREYKERLIGRFLRRGFRFLVPRPLRIGWACCRSFKFIGAGLRCLRRRQLAVPVLDAAAITVSLLRRDFKTASSVMFLLGIGELMEEWTHKKSVADLAGSMALCVDQVWLKQGQTETIVPVSSVQEGDCIVVGAGSMIPLDGLVVAGEAMVNQASLTGESIPVRKTLDSSVYAGTVLEEGSLTIQVKQTAGATRYEKIIQMIEDSEKLKSNLESKASHLADRLVPYSFLATAVTLLLTRNPIKAVSILMVDFSCALKLSMPVAVLSAMRECSRHRITVKGGKYLEALAEADTIVFDKTGTLTKSQPTVREVIPFAGRERDEMLRVAACLEEHFPHSIANAVVQQAAREGISHEEMHAKVHYVIAHGIASEIEGRQVCIGSHHFIFEDESCRVLPEDREKFQQLPADCSLLYLAIGGVLAAAICIEDPLRPEAPAVIAALKELGIAKTVMMTGDSYRTAEAIAATVGVDEFQAEVLPEEKAAFVQQEKAAGRVVVMIGDGINDSPALSAADAGIAIHEGAQLAREVADITISQQNLASLVTLKAISNHLMKRIRQNYRFVMSFNSGLLLLGLFGVLQPGTSAWLHNLSTLGIGLHSMTNLLPSGEPSQVMI